MRPMLSGVMYGKLDGNFGKLEFERERRFRAYFTYFQIEGQSERLKTSNHTSLGRSSSSVAK